MKITYLPNQLAPYRFAKGLLLCFVWLCTHSHTMAQSYPYAEKWQEIEEKETEGLLKSTQPLVDELWQHAKKQGFARQKIRALLYQSKIQMITEDNLQEEAALLKRFQSEINDASGAEKSILQSLLAELLNEYYRSNRYDISNRSNIETAATVTANRADFLTWSEVSFKKEITDLYDASLRDAARLQQEPIGDWAFVLDTASQYRELRPTLYDLLSHRAITYYSSNEAAQKADSLFQRLIQQHVTDPEKNAYLYNRLQQLNQQKPANLQKKTAALKVLTTQYPEAWYTAEVLLQLANNYQRALSEEPEGAFEARKKYADSILSVCQQAASRYPDTYANQRLQRIKEDFLAPGIDLQAESYNVPSQAIPVYLSHKNVSKIYVKVLSYKRTAATYQELQLNAWSHITKQQDLDLIMKTHPEVQNYAIDLKKFDDYQLHRTLVKFLPLGAGEYLALVSDNEGFKLDSTGVIFFQPLQVSARSLAYKGNELLLTDRELGKPLAATNITVYQPADNKKGLQSIAKVITDQDGRAAAYTNPFTRRGNYLQLIYQVAGEDVFFDFYQYGQAANSGEKEEPKTNIQFFTDRSIYRPGQTVYFKGILYEEINGNRRVLSNEPTTIDLYDPNDDSIKSVELTSNQFGSVFGSFTLPLGKATGLYSLEEETYEGHKEFSVEEYKRPTFEVLMDTVKETPRIGETITASGKAQAYSGALVSEGKVSYRVVRNDIYPYRLWSANSHYYPGRSEEIATGETMTDANGNFEVPFTAKPATEKEAGIFRFYQYDITLTVTDINGETREGHQTVAVGDKSVVLNISLPQKVNIDELDSISFRTNNLNGQSVPAKGHLQLTKLTAPQRILRDSPFGETDYALYDSVSFIQFFPHLPYGEEQKKETWPKSSVVLAKDFNSAHQQSVLLDQRKSLKAGTYLLESYVLDGPDTLRTSQLVVLFRPQASAPTDHPFLQVSTARSSYKAGEQAEILFSSAVPQATVMIEIEQDGQVIRRERLALHNQVKKLLFPVGTPKTDKLFVHYYMGRYNAAESGILTIPVQQPTANLTVSTRTFRDKLQPGQEETWELNISGADKDRVLAEVLAGMYDVSLDQFAQNNFRFPAVSQETYASVPRWNTSASYGLGYGSRLWLKPGYNYLPSPRYDDLEHFGFSFMDRNWQQRNYLNRLLTRNKNKSPYDPLMNSSDNALEEVVVVGERSGAISGIAAAGIQIRGSSSMPSDGGPLYVIDGKFQTDTVGIGILPADILSVQVLKDAEAIALYGTQGANGIIIITTKKGKAEAALQQVNARTNLQETAFFFPDLKTDAAGNLKIQFTTPESLTQWKLMVLAHTPTLETGYLEQTVRTSKDLMVVPNVPRFLREGDDLVLSAKIANVSGKTLSGSAKLMLFDAYTMQPVDSIYGLKESTQSFESQNGENVNVSWRLRVPASQQLVIYRVVAAADHFSDGEEAALPILPDQMMVTETLPIYAKEGQQKQFTLQALADAPADTRHVRLTLELTSNPIWYAIQALPYLQEYPYECSEQLFAKLYSTLVSKRLIDSYPRIKTIVDDWNKKGLLQSKLETNQELKAILLEETPWVREATDEETRMKRLALLFDVNNLRNQRQATYQKFASRQLPSGGFPWFEGGQANLPISTHIVAGFGRLKQLKAGVTELGDSSYVQVLKKAIRYLDDQATQLFKDQLESSASTPGYALIDYLYARSYFLAEYPMDEATGKLTQALLEKPVPGAIIDNLQEKAMLALIYKRFGKEEKSRKLIASLSDYAINDDEKGMYWKDNVSGWNWWQSPVETQAVLIEAFQETAAAIASIAQMKLWLMKNKQTNHWPNTKATAAVIYALLFNGAEGMSAGEGVIVKVGNKPFDLQGATAAAGYVKTSWEPAAIHPAMAQVAISKTSSGAVWGALYWQHFEKLTAIKAAVNGVQLEKELYMKKNSNAGPVLTPITTNTPLTVGDLVTVRMIIRADRDLEFIHLKDMRASGFEPVNVISAYKWQDGLGYYESTRDAATNFFIDRMPKGTYVFEYDVRANNAGNFANGISSIQSMYAPEMGAQSEGLTVRINE